MGTASTPIHSHTDVSSTHAVRMQRRRWGRQGSPRIHMLYRPIEWMIHRHEPWVGGVQKRLNRSRCRQTHVTLYPDMIDSLTLPT